MPWLKSEGKMPQNEKVWELSDAAYRLMDAGRHYAVQNMTDGHVPISRISALTPKPATKPVIYEVVKAKLWHQLPDICDACQVQRKEHGMTHYRDPKALRLHCEQIEKRIRQDAQRDAAERRREEAQRERDDLQVAREAMVVTLAIRGQQR